jgi:protein phosphatase
MLTMRPALLSEPGRRANNEDAAFASPRLVAVADGVGGAATGEVASRLAIDKLIGLDNRRLDGSLEQTLCSALTDANAAIAFVTSYDPRHTGMATTLTAVALSNEGAYLVANVGDSRAYLLREGRLRQLTRDDSLVQELIDQGQLSEEEARSHPQRSIVVDVLSGDERPVPKLQTVPAQIDDRLLLCSDGVTDYLSDSEVAEILKECGDVAVAVRQIVDDALGQGSRDNVTAVVADVRAGADAHGGWLSMPAFTAAGG